MSELLLENFKQNLVGKSIDEKLVEIYDFVVANHCKHDFRNEERFKNYLTNSKNYTFNKKKKGKVIGWTRGKGKTEVSIMYILICFYLYDNNLRYIFNPSETKELRKNLVDRINQFRNWPEDLGVIHLKNGFWLNQSGNVTTPLGKKVFIFLPQVVTKSEDRFNEIPMCDIKIVDEAQRRILGDVEQSKKINKKIKNNQNQILLSGSPYCFDKDEYDRDLISTYQDMPKNLRYWLPEVKLVSVGIPIDIFKSYKPNNELKEKSVIEIFSESNKDKLKYEISLVMEDALLELSKPKNFLSKHLLGDLKLKNKKRKLFEWIKGWYGIGEKVVFKTPTQDSADLLYEVLKELDVDNLLNIKVSHGKNDPNLKIFEDFWEDSKSLILIVVDRASMGFDNNKWIHTVDLTFGLNPITTEQFLDRQRPQIGKRKLYYKLCSDLTMEHTQRLMTFVLCLRIPWFYENFDGKNYSFLPLLKEIYNQIKIKKPTSGDGGGGGGGGIKPVPIPKMLPINENIIIDAFDNLNHKRKGNFEIFAEHTYGYWENKINDTVPFYTKDEILKSIEGHNFLHSWQSKCKNHYRSVVYYHSKEFFSKEIEPKFRKITKLKDIKISKIKFQSEVKKYIKNLKPGESFLTLHTMCEYFGFDIKTQYHTFRRYVDEILNLSEWFKDVTSRRRGQIMIKLGTPEMVLNWFKENNYPHGYCDSQFKEDLKKGKIELPNWFPKNPKSFSHQGYEGEVCEMLYYSWGRKTTANQLNQKKLNNEFDELFWGGDWKKGNYKSVANFRKYCMDNFIEKYNITRRQLEKILGDKISHQKPDNIPTKKIKELKSFYKSIKNSNITYSKIMETLMNEFPISRNNIKSILNL